MQAGLRRETGLHRAVPVWSGCMNGEPGKKLSDLIRYYH